MSRSERLLGLWSRHTVDNAAAVDTTHAAWRGRGLTILQLPTDMDFGRTFVAADPDGHRLRVFVPAAPD